MFFIVLWGVVFKRKDIVVGNVFENMAMLVDIGIVIIMLHIVLIAIALELITGVDIYIKHLQKNDDTYINVQKESYYNGNNIVCIIATQIAMCAMCLYIVEQRLPQGLLVIVDSSVLCILVYVIRKRQIKYNIIISLVLFVLICISFFIAQKYEDTFKNILYYMTAISVGEYIFINLIIKRYNGYFKWQDIAVLGVSLALSVGTIYIIVQADKNIYIGILFVICNYSILMFAIKRLKDFQLKDKEYIRQATQNELQQQYLDSVNEMNEYTRRVRHDIKNHINTLSVLLNDKENGLEKARKYLKQYSDQTALIQEFVKTNNKVVDAVINSKLMYCKENGINTSVAVDKNINRLTDVDLCCILGNIIDNAIEAQLNSSLQEKTVNISVKMCEDILEIIVKNRIEKSVLCDNKVLKTTKSDNINHGFGITNVKNIVNKYDGYMDIYEDNGWFYCIIRV